MLAILLVLKCESHHRNPPAYGPSFRHASRTRRSQRTFPFSTHTHSCAQAFSPAILCLRKIGSRLASCHNLSRVMPTYPPSPAIRSIGSFSWCAFLRRASPCPLSECNLNTRHTSSSYACNRARAYGGETSQFTSCTSCMLI